MSEKELYNSYTKEICPTCNNQKCSLCNITITRSNKEAKARCSYYEKKEQ
jgi:hypothetical protein